MARTSIDDIELCSNRSVNMAQDEPSSLTTVQAVQIRASTTPTATPERTQLQFFTILISLYLVLFIGALDQTIIATSIPTIASDLKSDGGSYAWYASAYLLANAATGPVWAKFSDIWGRKPALLGAVAWFAIASMIAALSKTSQMLIASRALQGAAAGGLAPLVSITFADLFSVRRRSFYLGLRELIWALAGCIGPLLGGALTQYASWRWNFWINLPVCGLAFVLLFSFLDVHQPRTSFKTGVKAFDWLGSTLIMGVTLMILLGLDFGGTTFSWSSPTVLCLIIFGSFSIGIFLYAEKSIAKHPLVPLRVFQNRYANAAFAVGFLNGMVYIAYPYYLPLYLQSCQGLTPFQSGLLTLPLIIPATLFAFLAGIFISRTGRYVEFIWIGTAFTTLITGLFIYLSPVTPLPVVGVLEALGGIALSMLFQAPTLVIQNVVTQKDTASAIATNALIRNISTAVSLILGGVVFQNGMDHQIDALRSTGLSESVLQAFSYGRAAASVNIISSISDTAQRAAVRQTFSAALHEMWIMYVAISGASFLLSGLIKHVDLKTAHTETKTGLEKPQEGHEELPGQREDRV